MQQILEEYQLFQLTTSHRGRPLRALQKTSMLYFNSLPHTEVDNDQRKEWLRKYISTHYLTQRQTLVYENTTSSIAISTHYLTQRQTTGDPKPEENFLNFNSLPHTEVDASNSIIIIFSFYFNSLPHTEVDAPTGASPYRSAYFNSLPHTEVDCCHI